MKKVLVVLLLIFSFSSVEAQLRKQLSDITESLTGLKIKGRYFFSYQQGEVDGNEYNGFSIRRGYITLLKTMNDNFTSRLTINATRDIDGEMEIVLKYLYAHLYLPDFLFVYKPNIEIGMVHMPWFEFENTLARYRMQGSPFMARYEIATSSDLGFSAKGFFGGELDERKFDFIPRRFAGYYGSFSFGLYNGGGYRSEEFNTNKVFQARLTIRPLPEYIAGLQFSGFTSIGKSNIEEVDGYLPDWKTFNVTISYESRYAVLSAQTVSGSGNKDGTFLDNNMISTDLTGYSFMAEGKYGSKWRTITKYDQFNSNKDNSLDRVNRYIVGILYKPDDNNFILLDYDLLKHKDPLKEDNPQLQLTWRLEY